MKQLILACAFMLPIHAHAADAKASRGPHGGIAAGMALQAARASAAHASALAASTNAGMPGGSGNGGSYWSPDMHASVVDNYQPWPEAEMRRFQKP